MSGAEWVVTVLTGVLFLGAVLMSLSDAKDAKARFEADRRAEREGGDEH